MARQPSDYKQNLSHQAVAGANREEKPQARQVVPVKPARRIHVVENLKTTVHRDAAHRAGQRLA